MSARRTLGSDTSGHAAAEMAMVLPLLLLIMFGSIEVGHYFYQEHIVVDAVRDGARYAARQTFDDVNCAGIDADVETSVKRATRLISPNAADTAENRRIVSWDSDDTVDVSVTCSSNVGFTGLYTNMADLPRVRVDADVDYTAIISFLGFGNLNLRVAASSEAAVVGA